MFEAQLEDTATETGANSLQRAAAGRRLRLLLLAHTCSPFHGSEKSMGWNRAVQSARFCDTWVICEERDFAPDIARYIEQHGAIAGLKFCFVAKTRFEAALARVPGLYYLSYNLWHRRAYRAAVRLHAEVGFDVVHQATRSGYREPGYLWRLDAPFIWGPLGGTQSYPWRFLGEAGLKGARREIFRNVFNTLQLHLSLRVRRAAQRADAVLAGNSTIRRDLEGAFGIKTTTLLDTGLPGRARRGPRAATADRPLRLLWSGIVEPRKALTLLIKALARLPAEARYELRILGQGSQRRRCERLARELGVEPHCRWLGWVPLAQVTEQYDWADVFVFTSLQDTTGTVVCEALGAGLPVVCLDHQGVGDLVDDSCGVKISVTTPREVVAGLGAAISKLARDRDLCRQLGDGAVRRARRCEWSYLAERTVDVYREVLSARERHASAQRLDQHRPALIGRGAHVDPA